MSHRVRHYLHSTARITNAANAVRIFDTLDTIQRIQERNTINEATGLDRERDDRNHRASGVKNRVA